MGKFDAGNFGRDAVNRLEELVSASRVNEILRKKDKKNTLMVVLSIIGIIVAVAGIAYALYKFFTPDYLEDFEDDFEDDFDDDYFEDEDFE